MRLLSISGKQDCEVLLIDGNAVKSYVKYLWTYMLMNSLKTLVPRQSSEKTKGQQLLLFLCKLNKTGLHTSPPSIQPPLEASRLWALPPALGSALPNRLVKAASKIISAPLLVSDELHQQCCVSRATYSMMDHHGPPLLPHLLPLAIREEIQH